MATPANPLDSAAPAIPAAPARERATKVRCEFCECELVGKGDYIELSDKAKKFRALKEENEKLVSENQTLRRDLEALRAAHPEPAAPKRRSII